MDLIERLRPRWRHPDPEVRAEAVRELGSAERERLAEIARTDPDVRVRRAAMQRLDDPDVLVALEQVESDPRLRALVGERRREVLVGVAVSTAPLEACAAALGRLDDERSLAEVAARGSHAAIRSAALARIASDRWLRDVVRETTDPATREEALGRIRDPGVLRALATTEGPVEVAVAALERIDDTALLVAIAETRGAAKAVRRRARERLVGLAGDAPALGFKEARARQLELSVGVYALRAAADPLEAAQRVQEAEREWRELFRIAAPRPDVAERFASACATILEEARSLERRRAHTDHARAAREQSLAARAALCERVEALDGPDVPRELEAARTAWNGLAPVPDDAGAVVARRFGEACRAAEARHRRWRAAHGVVVELAALVEEAEALAGATPLPAAKRWRAVETRWTASERPASAALEYAELERRFTVARERWRTRRQEDAERRTNEARENVARLEGLLARADALVAAEAPKAAGLRRELGALEAALADPGPLPAGEQPAAWSARLGAAREALLARLSQLESTEEWRRWANAAAQEEIIRRVEALLESNDLAEGVRQLGRLQDEWTAVASAPPEKAQLLWERFRTARNELRRRCDAYMAENLEKKRALCAEAAGLAESTSWNETAERVRRLQAEWKAIGPVPGKHARALWEQFREPCDRFFARRKECFDRQDAERRGHAEEKLRLCEQAEALADSTDWETAAAALKQLQAEWKRTGPPPREQAEPLWQRFRTACDRFFERRSRRGEIEREAALAAARTLCETLESLAEAIGRDDAPDDAEVGRTLDTAWAQLTRLEQGASAAALAARGRAACERIATARPGSLRGTRLDPATTRKRREKLCARLEELVASAAATPRARSVQEMALALRDRLASNTIAGGAGKSAPKPADALAESERLAASWALLGPVVDDPGRGLAARFERALARIRSAGA
jgi:hypothetical protein